MKYTYFHQDWRVREGMAQPFDAVFPGGVTQGKPVTLPQDAMILEQRDAHCAGKNQAGYYPAKTYTYTKDFEAPYDWKDQTILVEFEGVMAKALVYLNNEYLICHKYGYSGFFADLTPYLRIGGKNTLKVISVNQDLASRWYPGSGIYRDVLLWQGGKQRFLPDGVRLTTLRAEGGCASVKIEYEMAGILDQPRKIAVTAEIQDGPQVVAAQTQYHTLGETGTGSLSMELQGIHLWSLETPQLYTLHLTMTDEEGFVQDAHTETVGIRTLSLSAEKGLCVNGETVKLRGACIHHDNGIIGATTLYAAEEFRIRKLKEAGFNSIRNAHHPASKALLRACDRWGMLVMDELTDMWREPKNPYDFALDFPEVWQDEVARMVRKDYNHPSVALYSTGNEIPEIGRASGHEMNKKLVDALHRLDGTRFVTNAISGFLAIADHAGDFASQAEAPRPGEQASNAAGGSEQMNAMAGDMEKRMMDAFSVSPILSQCILPIEEGVDVAGYNYLTARHAFIHQKHPDWVVVGSETYPTEIADLWPIVENYPHVIGDFTWTGYDYLGEAGIGSFHYDSEKKDQGWYPDRLAYCGDIDLNGYRRPVSFLREIAYGLRQKPYLFVKRVDKVGHIHDRNRWKYHDGIHSWTFPGYEGLETTVYVLTKDPEAELFLNGVSLGKKKVGHPEGLTAQFTVPYKPGTLTVRTAGGEDTLVTAASPKGLRVTASKTKLEKGGRDVCFVTADLVDENGIVNRFEQKTIQARLTGNAVLAGFGSADPSCEGSYSDPVWQTYDGRVMAAVRSGANAGKASLALIMDGKECACVEIEVI
ncbi:MAG: DUF4982 domain-containing protein [Clostridia bacterium]|nr:DUF4982 domain-containing protein [Clostridia bacterium]